MFKNRGERSSRPNRANRYRPGIAHRPAHHRRRQQRARRMHPARRLQLPAQNTRPTLQSRPDTRATGKLNRQSLSSPWRNQGSSRRTGSHWPGNGQRQTAVRLPNHRHQNARPGNIRQHSQQEYRVHRPVQSPHALHSTGTPAPSLARTSFATPLPAYASERRSLHRRNEPDSRHN